MTDIRMRSSTCTTTAAAPGRSPDALLAHVLLGIFWIAAVAVLSLPQARMASAIFGWLPLWLLAMPLSAWLALQARRHVESRSLDAAPMRHRRRLVAAPTRRRAMTGTRGKGQRIRVRRVV